MPNMLTAFETERWSMALYHYFFALVFSGIIAGLELLLPARPSETHSYLFDLFCAGVFIFGGRGCFEMDARRRRLR